MMMHLMDPTGSWTALCQNWAQAGLAMALQATLLLGLGLLAGKLLSRRGPALQSLVYQVTLVGLLVSLPLSVLLAGSIQPVLRVSLPPAAPPSTPSLGDHGETARRGPMEAALPPKRAMGLVSSPETRGAPGFRPTSPLQSAQPNPNETVPRHESGFVWLGWLYLAGVGIWSAGVMSLLGRLGVGCQYLLRLRREGEWVNEGEAVCLLQRLSRQRRLGQPFLMTHSRVRIPFLAGVRRPIIFLPADYQRAFDATALEAILSHELVHRARRDCAWNLLARIACAFAWPHPLVWVLRHRLEQASEEVADQEVVRRGSDHHAYAHCLFTMAERLSPACPEPVAGVGVVRYRSSLGRRIEQILNARQRHPVPLSARLSAIVVFTAAAVVASSVLLVSASAAPRRPVKESQRRSSNGIPISQQPSAEYWRRQQRQMVVVPDLMMVAGLVPAHGPGLVITLRDAPRQPPGGTGSARVHDQDLLTLLNELGAAGAEALAIAGADRRRPQRIIANSALQCSGPGIRVNDAVLRGPYTLWAIGDPQRMERHLRRTGGAVQALGLEALGMMGIERKSDVTVPAYQGRIQYRYAKPLRAPRPAAAP